jgi:AraC-like DNA-binding protein
MSVWAAAQMLGSAEGWPSEVVDLKDVSPRRSPVIDVDALAVMSSLAARCGALDTALKTVLLPRLAGHPTGLCWAWDRIREGNCALRVSDVAAELGFSRKHFVNLYRAATGTTPKAQARRWRLSNAMHLVVNTSLPLAEVAIQCGYADQSHMNREFRELASCKPSVCRSLKFDDLPGIPAAVTESPGNICSRQFSRLTPTLKPCLPQHRSLT